MSPGSVVLIGRNDPADLQGLSREARAVHELGVRSGIVVTNILNGAPVGSAVVAAQLQSSMELLKPQCIRIGFISDAATAATIASAVEHWSPAFVILDPIGLSEADENDPEVIDVLRDRILPRTSLLTVLWKDCGLLIRAFPRGLEDLQRITISLGRLGVNSILVDTSDLTPDEPATTILLNGNEERRFETPRPIKHSNPRGLTSALIAARLAQGYSVATACEMVVSGRNPESPG